MQRSDEITALDVGNIVAMEHVNLTMPDQATATLFYIVGLGFTRDPYMNVGLGNMWVNVGEQQFHLPTRDPQVIAGHIGLVVPTLDALRDRLNTVAGPLADTRFSWSDADDHIAVTCPWGNRLRCYAPGPRFGDVMVGIPYVEFLARPGSAHGIAGFYGRIMGAPASIEDGDPRGMAAVVSVGRNQWLRFQETAEDVRPYDGHHIAVYVANISRPYAFLQERGLLLESVRNHQFRFQDIVDPETGGRVFAVEHEVRSMHHPMYRRPLVNRDPAQTGRTYVRGADALVLARG